MTRARFENDEQVFAERCEILHQRPAVVPCVPALLREDPADVVEDDAEDLGAADIDADRRCRRQTSDSTRAFRSLMAAWRM
jgi:hypothetical protein